MKRFCVFLTIICLLSVLSALSETAVSLPEFCSESVPLGNSVVFYEIFVGSFSDHDGDGIGDLTGIMDRMDYLNDGDPQSGLSLGIGGIWLTPVYASHSYHKYDVDDYYRVDPSFGTNEDLKALIDLCHSRGVKVILDLPINHTGKDNPWFKNFINSHILNNPSNIYYDLYSWQDSSLPNPAGRTFYKYPGTKVAYECNFSSDMPELNFDSPLARQYVLDAAKYYLEMGVDGFRFDAAKYIYYGDHEKSAEFWNWYLGELRAVKPDIYTVAEVWDSEGITNRYTPYTDCFHFSVSQASGLIAETAKAGDVNRFTAYVQDYQETIRSLNPSAQDVMFISNHDMDRCAGYLTAASGQMQMAANLYLLSPGSPFIYYGEEVGLRGSRGSASTDANRRLAMPWGDGDTVSDPVGTTYDPAKKISFPVLQQTEDKSSLYNYYKSLLLIRSANPEIAVGQYTALQLAGTKLGGFISTYADSYCIVLHNTSKQQVIYDLASCCEKELHGIAAAIGMGTASLSGTILTIDAQTSAVLR